MPKVPKDCPNLLGSVIVALHGVDAVAGVELVVGGLGGPDVGHVSDPVAAVGVVKQLKLVKVRVSVKLSRDGVFVPATTFRKTVSVKTV